MLHFYNNNVYSHIEVRSLFLRVLKTLVLELSMLSVCGIAPLVLTDSGTK